MLRLLGPGVRLCDGWNRREVMRIGGLGFLGAGLNLADLLRGTATADGSTTGTSSFGRARSCILLFLMGGPPQHSTWDPKPDAPAEVRGDFGPIATTVPGLSISRAAASHRPGGRQALHPAGRVHGRQRPLLQRLLHAHGAAPPADELRERQSGAAERRSQPGRRARPDRPGPGAGCRPRSRSRIGSSTPTGASGRARMRGSWAGRPTPGS